MGRVIGGHGEDAIERQSGVEERRHVAGPDRHGGAAAEEAAALALARGRGLERHREELAAAQLVQAALREEASRMPSRIWPLGVAARYR